LAQALAQHGARVLIIHGDRDALVPLWNSRRLASALPGASMEVYDCCGHMPMEECPQRFVDSIAAFVESL
jgi:pimeloyl-ACP methyl ester carboxylesterase